MPRKRKFKTDYPAESDSESLKDEQDSETIDQDVKDMFQEAQDLDHGRGDYARMLESYTDRSPVLSGGDLDADWEDADIGEEAVGGQNPTPDESVVDEESEALGITYNDNEPLRTTDKQNHRDRNPWELNPVSSPDFGERVKEEFDTPIKAFATATGLSGRHAPSASKEPRSGKTHRDQKTRSHKELSRTKVRRVKSSRASVGDTGQGGRAGTTKVARGIKNPPTRVRRHVSKGSQNKTKRT